MENLNNENQDSRKAVGHEAEVIAKLKGINKIINYIANRLDGDSRITLNIEKGHIWIEHFNGLEKIGYYEPDGDVQNLGGMLKDILKKEDDENNFSL